jgi:dTDP-4-amino-4,6-dideoxygalactose transaminase
MNEFQAAMGLCNLPKVNNAIAARKAIYEHYRDALAGCVKFQKIVTDVYNYAYLPVCFKNKETRDKIFETLKNNGVRPRKYFYPLVVDFEYLKNNYVPADNNLQNARAISNGVICLPIYPEFDIESADRIIDLIKIQLKYEA